jgi:hypothetical protein
VIPPELAGQLAWDHATHEARDWIATGTAVLALLLHWPSGRWPLRRRSAARRPSNTFESYRPRDDDT